MWETQVPSLGWEDPLEKEMVTHSSILAWRIPLTEKPGRLQSTGLQRVGHDWATSLSLFMSIKSVMPSSHLILCCPLLLLPSIFPASGSFQMSQLFTSGGQSIGVSASALVCPLNIWGWFPLGRTGWISLQSKGLSRVFSNTSVQKHQFFGAQLSL